MKYSSPPSHLPSLIPLLFILLFYYLFSPLFSLPPPPSSSSSISFSLSSLSSFTHHFHFFNTIFPFITSLLLLLLLLLLLVLFRCWSPLPSILLFCYSLRAFLCRKVEGVLGARVSELRVYFSARWQMALPCPPSLPLLSLVSCSPPASPVAPFPY